MIVIFLLRFSESGTPLFLFIYIRSIINRYNFFCIIPSVNTGLKWNLIDRHAIISRRHGANDLKKVSNGASSPLSVVRNAFTERTLVKFKITNAWAKQLFKVSCSSRASFFIWMPIILILDPTSMCKRYSETIILMQYFKIFCSCV